MDKEKKLVLPGSHLGSCEEFESGENTFTDNDETYSSTFGEVEVNEGAISVKREGKSISAPKIDSKLICYVTRADPNKARLTCMLEDEVEGKCRASSIDAVLPVPNVSRGHVESIRDAVKVGDIIKVRIYKIKEGGEIEVSVIGKDFGVLKAFCSKCRSSMHLKDHIFICNKCGWKERRKIPGGDDSFSRGRDRGRRSFGDRRDRGGPRRSGPRRGGPRDRPPRERK